jgi:hypothetical protein
VDSRVFLRETSASARFAAQLLLPLADGSLLVSTSGTLQCQGLPLFVALTSCSDAQFARVSSDGAAMAAPNSGRVLRSKVGGAPSPTPASQVPGAAAAISAPSSATPSSSPPAGAALTKQSKKKPLPYAEDDEEESEGSECKTHSGSTLPSSAITTRRRKKLKGTWC